MMTTSIFKENKYSKCYFRLIQNASIRGTGDELHHIIPKSCGGSDEISNRILLTFREHYVAHLLLVKIMYSSSNTNKMWIALWLMSNRSNRTTSKLYQNARTKVSNRMKTDNPMFNGNIAIKQLYSKNKNYNHSETAKKRNKEYWSNPVNKERLSDQNRKRWADSNNRQKMLDRIKLKNRDAGIFYEVVSPDGTITILSTKHDCAILMNTSDSNITDVIRKNRKTKSGFYIKEKAIA